MTPSNQPEPNQGSTGDADDFYAKQRRSNRSFSLSYENDAKPDAQAKVGLRNSSIHMTLHAWKNGDITMIELKQVLKARTDAAVAEAEELMGEAVIARHRQANYQWEKTESFIQSYQEQKRSNPHGLSCLQPPTVGEGESGAV